MKDNSDIDDYIRKAKSGGKTTAKKDEASDDSSITPMLDKAGDGTPVTDWVGNHTIATGAAVLGAQALAAGAGVYAAKKAKDWWQSKPESSVPTVVTEVNPIDEVSRAIEVAHASNEAAAQNPTSISDFDQRQRAIMAAKQAPSTTSLIEDPVAAAQARQLEQRNSLMRGVMGQHVTPPQVPTTQQITPANTQITPAIQPTVTPEQPVVPDVVSDRPVEPAKRGRPTTDATKSKWAERDAKLQESANRFVNRPEKTQAALEALRNANPSSSVLDWTHSNLGPETAKFFEQAKIKPGATLDDIYPLAHEYRNGGVMERTPVLPDAAAEKLHGGGGAFGAARPGFEKFQRGMAHLGIPGAIAATGLGGIALKNSSGDTRETAAMAAIGMLPPQVQAALGSVLYSKGAGESPEQMQSLNQSLTVGAGRGNMPASAYYPVDPKAEWDKMLKSGQVFTDGKPRHFGKR